MTTAKRVPALVVATMLVLSGCTSGRDEVVAAGDTAEADVIAAIDAAQAGTGRIEMTLDIDEDAWLELSERAFGDLEEDPTWDPALEEAAPSDVWSDVGLDQTISGEFSGDDYLVSVDGLSPTTILHVSGRTFESVEGATAYMMGGDLPDLELGGDEEPPELSLPEPPELPAGIEWIEQEDTDTMLTSILGSPTGGAHVLRSDDLDVVVDAGSAEVDGKPTRRYTASVTGDVLEEWYASETWGTDDTDLLSPGLTAIYEYAQAHTAIEVEIHLGDAGELVRLVLAMGTEVEPEYEDCMMLAAAMLPMTVTLDYSELGSDVQIDEPAPESVMSEEDFDELVESSYDDWFESGPFDTGLLPVAPSDRAYGPDDEPVKVQTSAGERYRADVEEDLVKFGSVVGIDPSTVADLDDVALVDGHDRAAAALAAMPKTPTVMGDMTRVELLWNVKWGMETVGVDPATADALGDAELAELIDAFVGENGVSGDGIWGDGPMSFAEMYGEGGDWVEEDWSDDEWDEQDWFDQDMFDSCPT